MKSVKILSGCLIILWMGGNLFAQSKITRYYKTTKPLIQLSDSNGIKKYVEIEMIYTSNPLDADEKKEMKNIFDLSGKGQEKLVEVLAKEYPGKTDEFMKALAIPIMEEEEKPVNYLIDKSDFCIVIKMEIKDQKNIMIPANRISRLDFDFSLKSDECSFNGFNNIQTRYDVIDFGKLSISSTKGFIANAGLDVTIGTGTNITSSSEPTLGLGYSNSITTSEESNISKKVLSQSGNVTEKKGSLMLGGMPANNLMGPLQIELKMIPTNIKVVNIFEMKDMFTDKNVANPPTKVTWKTSPTLFPDISSDIKIDLNCRFEYREVLKNHSTVLEGDDVIQPIMGTISFKDVTVLNKDDIQNEVYMIQYIDPIDSEKKKGLTLNGPTIYFSTRDKAAMFLHWLIECQSITVGTTTLKLNDSVNLSVADIEQLSVLKTNIK